MSWTVLYFPKVAKYVNKLLLVDRLRLKTAIEHLERYGPDLRQPMAKKIDKNLFELRIRGQDSFRILYTSFKGKYYLVNIFKKKSQKIPRKEIKQALDMIKTLI